ncbi:MAG: hypothetical protein KDA92_07070, partial [Planctomycetales bacterium]|nr:hypothetical protein [Planctomycetales bacterium]
MVINAVTGERVESLNGLPASVRWTLTSGLDDSRLVPPGTSGRFTTPTWFQMDDDNVWFARGGTSRQDGSDTFWVGLWRKGQRAPAVVYEGKGTHRWNPELVTVCRNGSRAA